jgi:hypothetical protein
VVLGSFIFCAATVDAVNNKTAGIIIFRNEYLNIYNDSIKCNVQIYHLS